MPLVPKTYERNTPTAKFYSSTTIGSKGYNPTITNYFLTTSSGDLLVRTEEIFDGKKFFQTVSGSNYPDQWPNYDYSMTYTAWEETTYSG